MSCKRCDGNRWILYGVPAKEFEIYKEKDYLIYFAKKCPECTRAKADSWERDFRKIDASRERIPNGWMG